MTTARRRRSSTAIILSSLNPGLSTNLRKSGFVVGHLEEDFREQQAIDMTPILIKVRANLDIQKTSKDPNKLALAKMYEDRFAPLSGEINQFLTDRKNREEQFKEDRKRFTTIVTDPTHKTEASAPKFNEMQETAQKLHEQGKKLAERLKKLDHEVALDTPKVAPTPTTQVPPTPPGKTS